MSLDSGVKRVLDVEVAPLNFTVSHNFFSRSCFLFFSVAGFHYFSVKSVVNLFFCLWVLQAFFLNYKRKAEIKQIDCGTYCQTVESGFFIQFAPNAKTLLSAESKTSMSLNFFPKFALTLNSNFLLAHSDLLSSA